MEDSQFISKQDAGKAFTGVAPDMGVVAPDFKKTENYTTFTAEHAVIDKAIVAHFFLSREAEKLPTKYFVEVFPEALSEVAKAHFDADYPRLKAAYSEDLKSWWLRADGFDHLLDIDAFMAEFFRKLDSKLDDKVPATTYRD